MNLFGDKPFTDLSKLRAGDYIALSVTKGLFTLSGQIKQVRGMHGGLLPDEMFVPLIIIPN